MKKIKIQIKSRFTGSVIFEYESENNTIKKTVEEAVKNNADLYNANLYNANLRHADLSNANLYNANLYNADLKHANLYNANLRHADLSNANLYNADLKHANLYNANLYNADLYNANLYNADLSNANLYNANLYNADLSNAKNSELVIAKTRILPEGDIIGYKKCKDNIIVKLLIPKEAKRSSAFGRKCRAEYAEVLEIYGSEKAYSSHDNDFVYEVGKTVKPTKPFSDNWQEECESGIHFFITKLEAENY